MTLAIRRELSGVRISTVEIEEVVSNTHVKLKFGASQSFFKLYLAQRVKYNALIANVKFFNINLRKTQISNLN